ncbi:SDR family oxidoreductase [Ottowia sp.]|uniref:SDR family oxidoreductase n=1 Tax=Ottowia sp. TaxID=1898956 RepID=UPI0025CF6288|nr:SDR family oxidoreductase [Ottowia sp.]MBK6746930.1 SDR family oxidoreductase [Ottowia sp.]
MNTSAQGLRVLVTAGAAGIGCAFASTFHEAGAKVFVCDIDAQALSKFRAEHPQVGTAVTDVAVPSQVDEQFDTAALFLGGLDVLINNAGIVGPTARVEDISVLEWDRTIAIDLNGMFYCTRRAVPLLKAAGGGGIINLSSIAGRLGYPLRTPYSAAKWAVVGFTKSLAIELSPSNIRVNAIQPGVVEGERVNQVISARAAAASIDFEASREQFVSTISLRRMVGAQDVANMALFLATPAGASISGQALSVCGDHGSLA